MTFGEKIREERLKAGLTQQQLADRLKVGNNQISQWETGKRKPKLLTLRKIAKAIGIPAGDMLRGVNQL